ncbi:uncharacterized protein KZ484_001875 isoform 1-T2 [Pholidichthys leucotaenia]
MSTAAGATQPPGGRQVPVYLHQFSDLLCYTPGGGVRGSQLRELPPPAVTCVLNPASSVSLSAKRSPVPGQRRETRRVPAVLVPQLRCGRRRRTDCYVESAPTTKRPRVSTEERFGPAGRDPSAFTPCGSSAWLPELEESQAALTIVLAAGPDAAEWEPDNDLLTTDPGSSQSWTASEPEIRRVLSFLFSLHIFEHFSLSLGGMSRVQPPAASERISPGSGAAGDPDPGSVFSPEPSSRVTGEELLFLVVLEGPGSTLEVGSGAVPTQSGSVVGAAPAVSDVGSSETQSGSDVGAAPAVSNVGSPKAQSGSDAGAAPVLSRSGEEVAVSLRPDARRPRHRLSPEPLPPGSALTLRPSQRSWWLSDAGRRPDPQDFRFGDLVQLPDELCLLLGGLARLPVDRFPGTWVWSWPSEHFPFPGSPTGQWAGRPPEPSWPFWTLPAIFLGCRLPFVVIKVTRV